MKRPATIYFLTEKCARVNPPAARHRRMNKAVSPSESVIRNLLGYSKALSVLATRDRGFIALVMN
ncbi:MAG TPA: hypothetical protein PKN12_08380 [Bacteroidales bacterium]|jgi:hypothetical protein|nr:hypothetical protein [Bacteroidales bacterium]HPT09823.1 hypothetical protein [Bacteroidales bacterium]